MSHEVYLWIKVVHFLGFTVWLGSIFGLIHMLREPTGGSEDSRRLLASLARGSGRAMDVGATIAIVAGVILLIKSPAPVRPIDQPYFHVKLTLAAGLVVLHGYLRARAGKLARGDAAPLGRLPLAIVAVLAIGILTTILVGPLYLHK